MTEEAEKKQEVVRPIGVAIHAHSVIDFNVYFNHMNCLAAWSKKYNLVLIGKKGLDAAMARNQIIERGFEHNCSHVLFMDDDHLFPVQTLDFLMETKDAAMVSGLVCKKGEGFPQVVFLVKDDKYLAATLPLEGNVYEVGVCAFGCTLVNLDKIKKLKKPYFRDTCVPNPADSPKSEPVNLRSDINMCNSFREIGEQVFVDTRVLVGHYFIDGVVYPQNASAYNNFLSLHKEMRKLREGQKGVYYELGE